MATLAASPPPLGFALDDAHRAHEPIEARGLARDQVRLLVSPADAPVVHARFTDLPAFLDDGDLVVVNTSATIAAALDGLVDAEPVVVHLSTELPGGLWLVEARRPDAGATVPLRTGRPATIHLLGGGRVALLAPFVDSRRLWIARLEIDGPLIDYLARNGRPIRYRYVPVDWPLRAYQTVFAREPGSAEMPSAARPFSADVVTDLVRHGIRVAPIVLHTGVSSLEGAEAPYPERFRVPRTTASLVNATHEDQGRVVAVGTTVVRALESATDDRGVTHPASGWTELVVTPARPPRAVDGLLTGWHEPEASHLLMLEAIGGREAVARAYRSAFEAGYLWHEFGDSHLLLPERTSR